MALDFRLVAGRRGAVLPVLPASGLADLWTTALKGPFDFGLFTVLSSVGVWSHLAIPQSLC